MFYRAPQSLSKGWEVYLKWTISLAAIFLSATLMSHDSGLIHFPRRNGAAVGGRHE